jgi:hypothetical protein
MQTEDIKRLVTRNIEANMQLINRAAGLLRDARNLGAEPGGLRSLDAQRLYSGWLNLSIDYYARLSDQSIQYLNAVVGLAEEALGRGPPPAAATRPDAEIRVSGARGQRLVVPFQLDNATGQRSSVSLAADDLHGDRGGKVAGHAVGFEPTAFTLEPGEQRIVEARVMLDKAFEPGDTYRTTIRVAGFPGREVRLAVRVLEDSAKAEAAGYESG